jgi:hypothetical protein
MAYYGRRSLSEPDFGLTGVNTSNQRGQIMAAMTQHGWGYAIGALGGKQSGQPNLSWRGGAWSVASATLDARVQYTSAVTVSNVASGGSDGQEITAAMIAPIQLWSGTKYGVGWAVTGGVFVHGMSQASRNPTGPDDYYFHFKSVGSSTPTNPFGATSSSYEGALTAWIEYEPNTAPTTVDATMSPANGAFVTTVTPDFSGDFVDANQDRGDKLKQFTIEVWNTAGTSRLWNSTQSATSDEQDAQRFTAAYGGSALTLGSSYKWRYKVSDQFGVFSANWSAWATFQVNAGGTVSTASGTPTGKQETVSPTPFTGVWSHGSALSTNAVEVRIKQGATVIKLSPTITKTVANGATASVTWAETTFTALNWGQSLTYEMRARDTGGLWSPWSAGRAFTTNASPTVPSGLTPSGGQVLSARPLLTAYSTDADDTTGTGFAVSARIKNDAGTLLFTRAMTLNTGVTPNRWEYQTNATDLASFATYRWDAVATDGTLTTAYSAEQSFVYGQGPVITVTAPTAGSTITTNTPTVSFSQDSTQVSYRVRVWEWDTATGSVIGALPAYDSGTIALAAAAGVTVNHTVLSGYLHNNTVYRVIVESTNNLALTGVHGGVTTTLTFPAVAGPAGYQASPIRVGNDVTPSAVHLSWQEPNIATDSFRGAIVTRRPAGSELLDATILAILTSPSQTDFVDYFPVSGQGYIYATFFQVVQGTDETESLVVEAEAMVNLEHVVINSVADGTLHVGLRYGAPMELDHARDVLEVQPWGQEHPHIFIGRAHQHNVAGTYQLYDDRYSAARDDLEQVKALHMSEDTVCYRDQFGERIFGFMTLKERKGQTTSYAEVAIGIRQNDHKEGVVS